MTGLEDGTAVDGSLAGGGPAAEVSDDSLFGDEYDLTEIKNLLERTPSGEDEAEELLEELLEASETVENQYTELTREEKATRLEIQYTYDCAMIQGELAEVTYEQTTKELEAALQEARDEVDDAREELEKLENWEEGIITAARGGTVSSVSYEAEDLLSASSPLISYYETETVYVGIMVSQYRVADISVGDQVTVTLSGYGSRQGTVEEKSPESTEEGSRTEVNYEVQIALDNADGRLSLGLSAQVSLEALDLESAENGMPQGDRQRERETENDSEEETNNE